MSNAEINYNDPAVKFKKYQRRRDLLPWWIKIFCWLFMLAACVVPIGIAARIMHYPCDFEVFGIGSHDPFSAQGVIAMSIFLFTGLTALFLWMEKPWAVLLAKINAIVNIVICIGVMGYFMSHGNFNIRLELIPLGIYLYKLSNIQYNWNNFDSLDEGIEYTDPVQLSE
jgi:hypothetical protein